MNDVSIKEFCITPENIQYYLNRELAAFGIETKSSLNGSMLYVDDEQQSRIVRFLSGNELVFSLEPADMERLYEIAEMVHEKKILMIWKLTVIEKNYQLAKQHVFNNINFYHARKVKNAAASSASISATGSATLSLSSTLAISFTGALFLSLVENHLLANNLKTAIKGVKVIVAFPVSVAELVTNGIVDTFEKLIINEPLTFMVLLLNQEQKR